ncbi:MAG: gliding motility protein GldM, partial [Paludibacteraceae bacterium]|nr:gliding motility protein GldM [Paludibacteraceae bacterium]
MIGMMYLVLTAMLALNVSTDILNGFTLVDNSLHSSIAASDKRNAQLYLDFQAANADNPEKTQEWFDKA